MNKSIMTFVFLCFVIGSYGIGNAEIKKATVPNVNLPPSLKSVMSKKSNTRKEKKVDTNGDILDEGNIIVDDIDDPKCVFYGNYNDGSGDAFQYFNIDTLVFECK